MKELINRKYKFLLYKDYLNDTFLLFDWGEIFEYSRKFLTIHCLNKSALERIAKMMPIFDLKQTDDLMFIFNINVENLPKILSSCSRTKRIGRDSEKIKKLEIKLGHKILPFNPGSLKKTEQ